MADLKKKKQGRHGHPLQSSLRNSVAVANVASLDSSGRAQAYRNIAEPPRFEHPVASERQAAAAAERLKVVAEMRDNIIHLSPDRHVETFADFASAMERRDLEYLADTITNWATGGHGYKYVGMPLKSASIAAFGKYKDDQNMDAVCDAIEKSRAAEESANILV